MSCKYTVFVSSCDTYEDLWAPFFTMLGANWENLSEKEIILNTETKSFGFENLDIKTFNFEKNGKPQTWSERLILNLKQVKTPYTLFLLDDFFMESPVDEQKIDECVKIMEQNKNVVNFCFVPTPFYTTKKEIYKDFYKCKRYVPFRVSTQAGLWRTKELIALLRKHENPWEFEMFASIRSRLRRGEYHIAKDGAPQAFTYAWYLGGAVHRGKWTQKVEAQLKQHNIDIDMTKRGFDEDIPDMSTVNEKTQQEKSFIGRLKIRVGVILKHWKSLI